MFSQSLPRHHPAQGRCGMSWSVVWVLLGAQQGLEKVERLLHTQGSVTSKETLFGRPSCLQPGRGSGWQGSLDCSGYLGSGPNKVTGAARNSQTLAAEPWPFWCTGSWDQVKEPTPPWFTLCARQVPSLPGAPVFCSENMGALNKTIPRVPSLSECYQVFPAL